MNCYYLHKAVAIVVACGAASSIYAAEVMETSESARESHAGAIRADGSADAPDAQVESVGDVEKTDDGPQQGASDKPGALAIELRLMAERFLAEARRLESGDESTPEDINRSTHLRLAAEHLRQAGEQNFAKALLEAAEGKVQKISDGFTVMNILYGIEDATGEIRRDIADLHRALLDMQGLLLDKLNSLDGEETEPEPDSPKAVR